MILHGKVFISTVSLNKSFEIRKIFEPLGASIIDLPMTECIEEDQTSEIIDSLNRIEQYQWIFFTSATGVNFFHKLLYKITGLPSIPPEIKIAVVGPKTGQALKVTGRTPDFTASGTNSENMIIELMEKELVQNCSILLPVGNLASDNISICLSEFSVPTRINVYKTVKTNNYDNGPISIIKNNNYDLILFTSPSGVMNFTETIDPQYINQDLRVACIGKVTQRAAEQNGLKSLVTAKISTYQGLATEILNFYYKIKN